MPSTPSASHAASHRATVEYGCPICAAVALAVSSSICGRKTPGRKGAVRIFGSQEKGTTVKRNRHMETESRPHLPAIDVRAFEDNLLASDPGNLLQDDLLGNLQSSVERARELHRQPLRIVEHLAIPTAPCGSTTANQSMCASWYRVGRHSLRRALIEAPRAAFAAAPHAPFQSRRAV